ncbi:tetratricopeptide repeat protein 24 isoform X1 [Arapaima gigas]
MKLQASTAGSGLHFLIRNSWLNCHGIRRMPSPIMTSQKMKTQHRASEAPGPDSSQVQADIEGLTVSGHTALVRADYAEALNCFKKAFKASLALKEKSIQRTCAFNLGAAYVESGKPQKGVEFLRRAQPGERGNRIADLQFNLGAAYEGLKDPVRAAKHYLQAAQLFRSQGQDSSEGDACMKLALCYLGIQDWTQAAQSYQRAGESYRVAARLDTSALALKAAASNMLKSDHFTKEDIISTLSECLDLSTSIKNKETLGELYNDVGLTFCQLKMFQKAVGCFKQALPLAQSRPHKLAVVLQNMGAIHNTLGEHREALSYHQQAVTLYGALGSRDAQGQSFSNLAFALSQLGDHEEAGENYLHALQAFKDAGDIQGQWQACEGLGATWGCLGKPERATLYYKQALALLSKCKDSPEMVHERLVNKLADALQDLLRDPLSHRKGLTPVWPQVKDAVDHRNFNIYSKSSLLFADGTLAKASEPLWPGQGSQIQELDFSHWHMTEDRHKMRHRSEESAAEALMLEQGHGQQLSGAIGKKRDSNMSSMTEPDQQLRGPQSKMTNCHVVMDEANRNLNNTCLPPATHCQTPLVPDVCGAAQCDNHVKSTGLSSNTPLSQGSDFSLAEDLSVEEAAPFRRKLKSRVCNIM